MRQVKKIVQTVFEPAAAERETMIAAIIREWVQEHKEDK